MITIIYCQNIQSDILNLQKEDVLVESTDPSSAVPDDENTEPSGESIEAATENGIPPENELHPDDAEITTFGDPYRKPDIESGKYQVFQFIFCIQIF